MSLAEIANHLPLILASLFVAILFTQSGLAKVFNFSGNMEWLKGHFSKTFLAPTTPMMVVTITILEVITGLGTAIGLIYFLATGATTIIWYASILGAAALCGLFFGQRAAQDYPGAAILVPYFILQLILIYLSKPVSV